VSCSLALAGGQPRDLEPDGAFDSFEAQLPHESCFFKQLISIFKCVFSQVETFF
jgi:hypothetical protein